MAKKVSMYILTCQGSVESVAVSSPRRARSPAQSRKQQIVQTVLELVAAHGTEALSAQLVADAIGITQPAVFRHFPTKEAMWLAVMAWLEQQLIALASVADGDCDGLTRLSRIFLRHMVLIERYPALPKLVFSDHLRLQYPSLQARFGSIHQGYIARISAAIELAKSDGAVCDALDPRHAATMLLSLVQGLGFQFAIARVVTRLIPEAERLLGLYIQAITAPPGNLERARMLAAKAKRSTRHGS